MIILVTASDFGAANNLEPIVQELLVREGVILNLVAAEPAYSQFKRHGLDVTAVPVERFTDQTSMNGGAMIRFACEMLQRLSPDVVLTGTSGPDAGIDEAMLIAAREFDATILTATFQEYWGDVNPMREARPKLYFVSDDLAQRETIEQTGETAIPVGMPAYANVSCERIDTAWSLADEFGDLSPISAYFGQPLWFLEGYERNLFAYARCLKDAIPDIRIMYRGHPRETAMQVARANEVLDNLGVLCDLDHEKFENEIIFCAVDVVASCYSMTGVDTAYWNRLSPRAMAVPFFSMTDSEVHAHFVEYTRHTSMPLASRDLALQALSEAELMRTIKNAFAQSTRRELHHRHKRELIDPQTASARVANELLARA